MSQPNANLDPNGDAPFPAPASYLSSSDGSDDSRERCTPPPHGFDASSNDTARADNEHCPGASGVPDAPPSNRASDSCIGDPSFQLLRRAVDWLEVSYRGELNPIYFPELQRLKEIAQMREPAQQATAQLELAGGLFSVSDKGMGRFPFAIRDERFLLKLGRGGTGPGSTPVALVQIRSEYLAEVGTRCALAEARTVVACLAEIKGNETVSRVDLAVDFCSTINMESWHRIAWITRAQRKNTYSVGDTFTGWSIGLGGDIAARLYDKTFEIETESGKYYLHEIWKDAGWFPVGAVWRLELQLRRPALAKFNLRALDEVLKASNGLWAYLTSRWLRLSIANTPDETRSRWITHPLWASLSAVCWRGSTERLNAIRSKSGAPSDKYIACHGTGVLTSYMAKEGITEVAAGFKGLQRLIYGHWERKEEWEGAPADVLIVEQVRAKGRKYGTINNVAQIRERDAGADEDVDNEERREATERYRKASRG